MSKVADKLRKEIAARHRLEREILEISEREQRRIGRDLHDDLGQQLVGISYMSHLLANSLAASASPEAEQARKINEALKHALALTRSLARGLHPVALKSGGLLAAMADLAERTADIFQIRCEFTGPAEEPDLPENKATHLYRIAQEAVTNAVNHGKASRIRIAVDSQAGQTTLTVADNGCGMPAKTSPRRRGMGLRIMQYRARAIGGALDITTTGTGGTIVTCAVAANEPPATGGTA
jgi:signal transduction histidine kinase